MRSERMESINRTFETFFAPVYHCPRCASGVCAQRGTIHGHLRDFRFVARRWGRSFEFVPNGLMILMIRKGRITAAWKVPLIFGRWKLQKENS